MNNECMDAVVAYCQKAGNGVPIGIVCQALQAQADLKAAYDARATIKADDALVAALLKAYAAAAAAYAAADVAYKVANAATRDTFLTMTANIGVQALRECKAHGVTLLDAINRAPSDATSSAKASELEPKP